MKQLVFFASFFFSTLTFGKEKIKIEAKYGVTVRMGNIITRWYYDILGTSLLFEKRLILFSDKTYGYSLKGGECGTFDINESGIWRISNDTIYLKNNQIYSNRIFIIKDKRLYDQGSEIKKDKYCLKLMNENNMYFNLNYKTQTHP